MIFQDKRKNEIFVDLIERVTGVINADVSVLCTRGFFFILKSGGGGVQMRKVTFRSYLDKSQIIYCHIYPSQC